MHHPSHRGIANFINPNSRWFVIGFTSVAAFIYAGSLGYFMGINISQQYMMGPSENGWHISQLQPIGIGNTLFADKPIFCVFTWVQNLFFFKMFAGVSWSSHSKSCFICLLWEHTWICMINNIYIYTLRGTSTSARMI